MKTSNEVESRRCFFVLYGCCPNKFIKAVNYRIWNIAVFWFLGIYEGSLTGYLVVVELFY